MHVYILRDKKINKVGSPLVFAFIFIRDLCVFVMGEGIVCSKGGRERWIVLRIQGINQLACEGPCGFRSVIVRVKCFSGTRVHIKLVFVNLGEGSHEIF